MFNVEEKVREDVDQSSEERLGGDVSVWASSHFIRGWLGHLTPYSVPHLREKENFLEMSNPMQASLLH